MRYENEVGDSYRERAIPWIRTISIEVEIDGTAMSTFAAFEAVSYKVHVLISKPQAERYGTNHH